MRILIVDDDQADRLYLESLLRSHGYEVECAQNGAEALEKLNRERFDLVITDILMPLMDGFQLTRTCKKHELLMQIPILMCSGTYTDGKDEELALRLGVERFLRKPVEPDALAAIVDETLRKESTERRLPPFSPPAEEKDLLQLYNQRLVTKLEKKMLDLQVSEAKYRTLFESVNDLVFSLDKNGCFVDVNCRTEMFGYTPAEVIGRPVWGILAPRSREIARATFEKAKQEGSRDRYEVEIVRKDGGISTVELNMATIYQDGRFLGRFGVARDMTKHHQAEVMLCESEEKFRQIAETIREVFWITDPEKNTMLYVSPHYETIWGRSCASLLASPRSWIEAIHPEDRERVLQAAVTRQPLGTYREEYRILRPDGTLRWIQDQAYPVRDEQGNVSRVVGVAEDITERKTLLAQLIQSQKMEAYGLLASGVAHDFNNILGAIIMQADIARLRFGEIGELGSFLDQIQQSAQRAAGLTRQLLLFSRQQPMVPIRLELGQVVDNLLKMLRRLIGEDVAVHTEFDPDIWPILGDSTNIEQVIMNLVVNARDAMPQGGALTLRIENCLVDEETSRSVPGSRPGAAVVLSVIDTGTGMDKEIRRHLFEPFFTTKQAGKGSGLGLAVVFGIMRQHQGWISVESAPGKGTAMRCYFPAVRDLSAAGTAAEVKFAALQGRGERLLVVEDESNLREAVVEVLRESGYTVFAAANSGEARSLFAGEAGRADLVFSDVVLPDGSSVRLVEDFLKQKPGLAVLLSSGYTDQRSEWSTIKEHGYAFLQKPYSMRGMLEAIKKALQVRPPSA